MSQIAKLLEKATGPDRELDARISFVDGLHFCWCGGDNGGSHCEDSACKGCGKPIGLADERHSYPLRWQEDDRLPPYTASVDAALALVERRLPGHKPHIMFYPDNVLVRLDRFDKMPYAENGYVAPDAVARTAPLAILAALLTALRSQEDKPR